MNFISNFLGKILDFLNGSIWSKLLGLIGLGGILIFLKNLKKKVDRIEFEKNIDAGAIESGIDSSAISTEMRDNDEWFKANQEDLNKLLKQARDESVPVLDIPVQVKAGEQFKVSLKNIVLDEAKLFADDKWQVGILKWDKELKVLFCMITLQDVGSRKLSCTVLGQRVDSKIEVY